MRIANMQGVLAIGLLATIVSVPGTAAAADGVGSDADKGGLEEIIVTAQRRDENLQSVPLAVTAITGDELSKAGATNSLDIADAAPNIEIRTSIGVANVFIRGIGNNDWNPSVVSPITIYRDEVPLASTGSQIFSLVDLEGVEVLRGPQGTLFGKNTIGGALLYKSKLPTDQFEGYAKFGVGRFDLTETEAAVNVPLTDTLAVRVAGIMRKRDGERINVFKDERANDIDEQGVRAIARWTPSDEVEIRLTAGLARDRSDFQMGKPVGLINGADLGGYTDPYPNDWTKLNFDLDTRNYLDNEFANLTAIWEFTEGYQFKSISAYDTSDSDNRIDADESPNRLNHTYVESHTKQYSQEFQLSHSGDRLDWVAGVFLFREDFNGGNSSDLLHVIGADFTVLTDVDRENTSYALFGQGTYELTSDLRLTVGGRYTYDKVDATHRTFSVPGYFDPDIPDGPEITILPEGRLKDDWGAWSGRIALDYDFNDNVMGYVSATRGFRAGGFNMGSITSPAERTKVDPEYLNAYEVGVKSMLFDRRLRLNLSAFHYDYEDLQVPVYRLSTGGGAAIPVSTLENAATANVDGVEAEATWRPAQAFELGLNMAWLDARFDKYESAVADPLTGAPIAFSGNRMAGSPKYSGSVSATYFADLSAAYRSEFRVDYSYTGKQYHNAAENDAISSGGSYKLLNARVTLASSADKWDVALWGRNLTDEEYIYSSLDLSALGWYQYAFNERRTYGLSLGVYF